ncbi:MAG: hypothetical protein JNM31_14420 [Flavobacteriales bacterium]|nr:hypothetical protein [Flavobacteriales bacterium]
MSAPRSLFLTSCMHLVGMINAQISYQWEQRASFPGPGRWGAITFAINGKGYVVGGHNGTTTLSDAWMYDPSTDTWLQRASIPVGRRLGSGFTLNGKGFVSCGLSGSSTKHNDLWEYDPVVNSWTQRANFPSTARYGTHGFALGGYGYVGSGNIGTASGPFANDMWRYDPTLNTWNAAPPLPGPTRYGTTSFTIAAKGYVHGGMDATLNFTNDLYEFDPIGGTWTPKPAMPGVGRSYAMVMPFAVDAVVACGKDQFDYNMYDAYWYQPSTNTWTSIAAYPGQSGWGGASFQLAGRAFGGLGQQLLPTISVHDDFWELVRTDATSLGGDPEHHVAGREDLAAAEIHPNPAAAWDNVFVSCPDLPIKGGHELRISDAQGRIVKTVFFIEGMMVELTGLAPGIYSLSIANHADGLVRAQAKLVVAL